MKHVFISYSSADGDFADLLRVRLEQEGFDVWTDNGNLVAGDDWRDEIDQAIRDAFAVIVVMTPNSRSSQYVTFEWSFALGIGNVKVIPLLKEAGGDTHPRIDPLQRLDFRNRKTSPCNDLFDLLRKSSSAGIAGSGAATGRAASTTPSVEILTPVPGEGVDFRQTVQGTVYPPGSSVQVLIHSLDDFWHLQKAPSITGRLWSVECQFGNEEGGIGNSHEIIAVHGTPIREKKLRDLPDGLIVSDTINVARFR